MTVISPLFVFNLSSSVYVSVFVCVHVVFILHFVCVFLVSSVSSYVVILLYFRFVFFRWLNVMPFLAICHACELSHCVIFYSYLSGE